MKMKSFYLTITYLLLNFHYYCNCQEKDPRPTIHFPESQPSLSQPWLSSSVSSFTTSAHINNYYNKSPSNFNQELSDKISQSIMRIGQQILTKFESMDKSKSHVLSPISIASSLSLLLLGSNKQTYKELLKLFNLENDNLLTQTVNFHEEFGYLINDITNKITKRQRQQTPWKTDTEDKVSDIRMRANKVNKDNNDPDHQIEMGNGIFIRNSFNLRPTYESIVRKIYQTEITPLDFRKRNGSSAKDFINNWVEQKTHGKIKEIITEPLDPLTDVIIANALYFKAFWETTFFESATKPIDYYPNGRNSPPIKVPMMANAGVFPFYDAKEYDCQILGLPYKGNETTMYIILPKDSSPHKLRQFHLSLKPEYIDDMISKMRKKTAVMLIPKLNITNTISLTKILSELGVPSLFDRSQSDLSIMIDAEQQNSLFSPSPVLPLKSLSEMSLEQIPSTSLRPIARVALNHSECNGCFTFSRSDDNQSQQIWNQYQQQLLQQQQKQQQQQRSKRSAKITYKVESIKGHSKQPLRLKDFILNKRITKHNPDSKKTLLIRNRRQLSSSLQSDSGYLNSLNDLEKLRLNPNKLDNPFIYVGDMIHKVNLDVNERGTEAGAVTLTYLRRSGTQIVFRADAPYIILIRHDPTKIPLFYGTIYEPTTIK